MDEEALRVNVRRILFVVVGAVLLLMFSSFNTRVGELNRLRNQLGLVAGQATVLQEQEETLELAITHAASDAAVREWAYEEGHYKQPGDEVVVVVPLGTVQPPPTPAPETVSAPPKNWEVWWALFFDQAP